MKLFHDGIIHIGKVRFRYTIEELIYIADRWFGGIYPKSCPICDRYFKDHKELDYRQAPHETKAR